MFTTNYWTYKSYIESQNIDGGSSAWRWVDIGLKGLDGSVVKFQQYRSDVMAYYYSVIAYCGVRSALNIVVGTGTTDPSMDDYALGADVTNSFINRTCSYITGPNNATVKTVITSSGTNNTGSPITITEYGITKGVPTGNQVTTPVLFFHELLPDPIVVQPGCQFILPIEWVSA